MNSLFTLKIIQCQHLQTACGCLKKALRLWPYALLILILSFAFYIRSNTFWLPHWQGDQSHFVMLAAKWEKDGIKAYNLSGVDVGQSQVDVPYFEKKGDVVFPIYTPNTEGYIYQTYTALGFSYYRMPLFYKAPLFPILLSYSHRFFAGQKQNYTIVLSNLGPWAGKVRPPAYFKAQFWAVIVPLAADLVVILLTFFLGRYLFGNWVGLYAGFLMSIHPVNILSSYRLLLESSQLCFLISSLFLFFVSFQKKFILGIFFSGILGGLAVLTKQNAVLLAAVVWLYTAITHERKPSSFGDWWRLCVNKSFVFYFLGMFLMSFQWFLTVYQTYGNPFWYPSATEMMKDALGWTQLFEKRPHPIILYPVGIPYMCPFFLLAYFSVKKLFFESKDMLAKKSGGSAILFLWLWVLVFFIYLLFQPSIVSREHRYLLITYPALAILAGERLSYFRTWVKQFFVKSLYADILIVAALLLCAWWSVPMAMNVVYAERNLIRQPF